LAVGSCGADDAFPPIVDTEPSSATPLKPEQAAAGLRLSQGFHASLFAGEPDVQQPIAMALDERGRLWVAENYTYAEQGVNFSPTHRDRIIILEDSNHNGRFDRRKVFWDRCEKLTGIELGFGGVWALVAPNLVFVRDRNRDDAPDGEPIVVLDGWNADAVRHNVVNGLKWGPDGWLYGRHGILATSFVGRPDTPKDKRRAINCGIWRYHPTRLVFEVVAHGTTNPWGLDFDEHGQMFISNTVIGHLWHVIPGAHYRRMYGEDFDAHVYDLIDQHADHYHWDTGKKWYETRDAAGPTDALGGGHAHCGLMIYLGDNWPQRCRNTAFMCNLHGRRVNNDRLVRHGSGYVALHAEDFLKTDDPWFRGIELVYGPDGGVYIADWCDVGECHENDGVHRRSGRIFKVTYGTPSRPRFDDLLKLADEEIVKLLLDRNEWYSRTARRILQERAAAGRDLAGVRNQLRHSFENEPDVSKKLRALWGLYGIGGTTEALLRTALEQDNEHVRAWAIRLLVDERSPSSQTLLRFGLLAERDPSGLVRLFLASALQRLPLAARASLANALVRRAEDAADHNLPLMLWYGIEPLIAADPNSGVALAECSRIPLVRRYIARRLTEGIDSAPAPVGKLLALASGRHDESFRLDVLGGMVEALRGWQRAKPPENWTTLQSTFLTDPSAKVRELTREVGVVFGDGRAVAELRHIALSSDTNASARRAALQVLIDNRADDLLPLLRRLVTDRATAGLAVRGLALFDDPATPGLVLEHFRLLPPDDRREAIDTLSSRPGYARLLLDAVTNGGIARDELTAYHARQIHSFNDQDLNRRLAKVWGEVRSSPDEKKKLIANYKSKLTPATLSQANRVRGRQLFDKACASCHRLFGNGAAIGPDLTGGNRDNLDYLLENIIDPSAVVGSDYRISVVELSDGRLVTGVVGSQSKRIITVQTQTDRLTIDRSAISAIRGGGDSLMPDSLLTGLTDAQVVDLIAYLQSKEQVLLPADAAGT
jgi:putative membrane-bound dehydrogenase-like protein